MRRLASQALPGCRMAPRFWPTSRSSRRWRQSRPARSWGWCAGHPAPHPDQCHVWRAVCSPSRFLAQCMELNAFAMVQASFGCIRQLCHYRCPAFAHARGIPTNGLLQSPTPSPGYRPRPPPMPHAYRGPSRDPAYRPASCFWINMGDPTSVERTDPAEHLPLGKPSTPTTRSAAQSSRATRLPGIRTSRPSNSSSRRRGASRAAGTESRRMRLSSSVGDGPRRLMRRSFSVVAGSSPISGSPPRGAEGWGVVNGGGVLFRCDCGLSAVPPGADASLSTALGSPSVTAEA